MKDAIYIKYSNERDDKFKIKTLILKDEEGNHYVEKYPLTDSAKKHISDVAESGKELSSCARDTKFCFSNCVVQNDTLVCEFAKGISLSSLLVQKLNSNDQEGMMAIVQEYCSELYKMATEPFSVTEKFCEVFGNTEFDQAQMSCPVTDVDMIFNNIIVNGDEWKVLDYEWTYSFPIPVKFVVYRSIMTAGELVSTFLQGKWELLDISENERYQFKAMEAHFQRYVTGGEIRMGDFQNLQNKTDLATLMEQGVTLRNTTGESCYTYFYWDTGEGYQAEQYSLVMGEETQHIKSFHVEDIPEGCVKVRFDPPGECPILVKNCIAVINETEECELIPLNGVPVDHKTYLFQNVHAQMEFCLPEHTEIFTVKAEIHPCLDNDAVHFAAIGQARAEEKMQYDAQLHRCREEIARCQEENAKLVDLNQQLERECSLLEDRLGSLLEVEQAYYALQENTNLLQAEYESVKGQFLTVFPYKQAYEELVQGYRRLETQYLYILNSRFWRMTAPMRKIWGKFKSSKVGRLLYKTLRHMRMFGLRATLRKTVHFLKKKRRMSAIAADTQSDVVLLDLKDMVQNWETAGADISLKEAILKMEAGKGVLIVSHELNLTGAPVAIEYMAKCFKKMGKDVVIVSPHDGNLRERFTGAGMPVIVYDPVYQSNLVKRSATLFELIVVSTNVGAPLIAQLSGMPVPVMWWIHEARASYFEAAVNAMPEQIGNNIHVYCGGAYAQNLLREYRPAYTSELFLYCTPDHASSDAKKGALDLSAADGKTVFALVGMLEERKGQDILAEAICRLSPEKRQQCYFVFVGRQCYLPQYTAVKRLCSDFPQNVCYIEELKREDLACLYDRMDCLICASRDDPMPIVVTDALSLSKCVICSENTGSAALLQAMNSGLIYRNNSPDELSACIAAVLDGVQDMAAMCQRARETYEQYFTEGVFKANLVRIVNKIAPNLEIFIGISDMYLPAPMGIQREVYGRSILDDYSKNSNKNILLLSHELSLTGAPVVLHKMAVELRSQGHNVTILSPFDGELRKKFTDDGFPVVIFEDVYDSASNDFLPVFGNTYDLIVINTVVTYRALFQLSGMLTPVVWWIHDSHASYTYGGFGKCLPAEIPANVKIRCVGNYALQQLLQHYPHYEAGELLYAIDDCATNTIGTAPELNTGKRKLFVIVGTIELRKGQDVAVEAIRRLPADVLEKCQFVFVGKVVEQPVLDTIQELCQDMPENVRYIGAIPRNDLIALYRDADCLICSSRDDPMPVVVTEMQALSKPVICSENTGSAALIHHYGGGLTYPDDDPAQLAEQICRIAGASKKELAALGKEGRKLYENCFSENKFSQELRNLVEQECSVERKFTMTTVSVVIPTYNAGEAFREMLIRLNAQRGVGKVEVLVVDSGSSDGTQQMAVEYGARLIQISQAEFSHSYARNLGAENATGQVLLFMTQDALPSDENWVRQMVLPILTGKCCATSCREHCPEGTDLYYKIASWNHARYLGVDKESRIGKYVPNMDAEELRKSASLNDVSTAIDRNLFRKMGYRHSFAEDLDMGIRILQAGKNIKLLHEPTVIHGHTRAASYYLRRGLAEGRALERIMGVQETDISAKTLAEMIITGYGVLQNAMVQIQAETGINTVSALVKRFNQLIQDEMANPRKADYGQIGADAYVETCVQRLENLNLAGNNANFDLVHMVLYYVSNVLSICLEETGWADGNLAKQCCDCIYKQMALVMGNCLAHMDPAEPCFQEFQQMANGV